MRKLKIFLPILIAFAGVLLFTQCKKDHSCNMKVTCKYSSNGMDADSSVVSHAIITLDTSKYVSGLAIDTNISRLNIKDIDSWSVDSLYRWCENGCILYRIDDQGKKHPYSYEGQTDANGEFYYSLPYPALLIVKSIKVDAIKDTLGNILEYVKYTGTTQVQVNEGETTEKTILMVETN